jgi:hypothetical protein
MEPRRSSKFSLKRHLEPNNTYGTRDAIRQSNVPAEAPIKIKFSVEGQWSIPNPSQCPVGNRNHLFPELGNVPNAGASLRRNSFEQCP